MLSRWLYVCADASSEADLVDLTAEGRYSCPLQNVLWWIIDLSAAVMTV